MKKLALVVFTALAILCGRGTHAQEFAQISFDDLQVDEIIQARVGHDKDIMGLGLAVVHNGNIVYLRGYGYEDWESQTQVDPMETRFRWASISKTLTAAAAVVADSTGQVELDKDISSYYPTYKTPAFYMAGPNAWNLGSLSDSERVLTMRMLLSHTSGIQHYSNGLSIPTPPVPLTVDKTFNTGMEWALAYWASAPLVAIPGTQRNYSTFGYNLAGVVLEQKTGVPFETLVQATVGDPAGMSTLRADTLWDEAPRRAVGYFRDSDGEWVREVDNDVSWKLAGGGFISTVADMGRYAGALLNGDILTQDEMDTLFEPQTYNDGTLVNNGGQLLGWIRNGSVINHSGAQLKGQCLLTMRRNINNDNLAIAIMTNASLNYMIDLEADGFYTSTGVDLGSLESEIRSLIIDRLDSGQPPIIKKDRSIMRAEKSTFKVLSPILEEASRTSVVKSMKSVRK